MICYGLGRKNDFSEMLECKWEPLSGDDTRTLWAPAERAFLLPFFGQGQMSHARMRSFLSSPELLSCWEAVTAK